MKEVDDFNRRFRVGDDVDVLWDRGTGFTTRHRLLAAAGVWPSGEAVVQVEDCGFVLCEAIHMPAGVGG